MDNALKLEKEICMVLTFDLLILAFSDEVNWKCAILYSVVLYLGRT